MAEMCAELSYFNARLAPNGTNLRLLNLKIVFPYTFDSPNYLERSQICPFFYCPASLIDHCDRNWLVRMISYQECKVVELFKIDTTHFCEKG